MPARDVKPVPLDIAADRVFRPEPKQFIIGHLPDVFRLLREDAVFSASNRPGKVARIEFADLGIELLHRWNTRISRRSEWLSLRISFHDAEANIFGKSGGLFFAERLDDVLQLLS